MRHKHGEAQQQVEAKRAQALKDGIVLTARKGEYLMNESVVPGLH